MSRRAMCHLISATSLVEVHAVPMTATDLQPFRAELGLVAKSWFNPKIADNDVTIPGCSLLRTDRL